MPRLLLGLLLLTASPTAAQERYVSAEVNGRSVPSSRRM